MASDAAKAAFPSRFEGARLLELGKQHQRFEAFDAWDARPVTLAVLRQDAAAIERLGRAYRFLSLADSPHLPRALDFGTMGDGAPWMSLVPVASMPDFPAGGASEAELRRVAVAGARALLEAHRHGLLHRCVNPGALGRGADGQVVLAMWECNGPADAPDGSVPCPGPYLAPEALAGQPSPSSDFFALGATLYALATGQPPQPAPFALAERALWPLGTARPDLTPALTRVVESLLASSPAERHADGLALLAALGAPLLPSVASPPVGQELPLDRLMKAFESFQRGSGGAIVVTGGAGLGKSTLLRRFGVEVALKGGRVVASGADAPGDRLSGMADWLRRRGLGPDAGCELPDPAMSRSARLMVEQLALNQMLAAASARGRLVLVFEDLGLDEEESLSRLERLLAGAGSQVMVVASVRGDEAAGGRVLARLKRNPLVRELAIRPLPPQAAEALAAHALGAEAPGLAPVAEAIAVASGRPLQLIETLLALVEGGQLVLAPTGWVVAGASGPLPLAPSLDAVLTARLEALGLTARRLAAAVALIGDGEATREFAAAAIALDPAIDLAAEFQTLVAEHWLVRDGLRYRLGHGLMRTVLLRSLSHAEQREAHARLASLLTERRAPAEAIARHWAAAGEQALAALAFERAAERDASRGASLDAYRSFQAAYRQHTDAAERRRLAGRLLPAAASVDPLFAAELAGVLLAVAPEHSLGAVTLAGIRATSLAAMGRFGEALAQLDAATPGAEAQGLGGLLEAYRAMVLAHAGIIGRSQASAAAALRLLSPERVAEAPPEWHAALHMSRLGALVSSVSFGAYMGRVEDAEAFSAVAEQVGTENSQMAAWPWLFSAQVSAMIGQLGQARAHIALARRAMDEAGASPLAEVRALAIEAMIATRAGELDQALRSGAAAVAVALARAPYPPLLGLALVAHAEALLATGQTAEAEAAAAEAQALNAPDGLHILALARLVLAEAMLRRAPAESERLAEAVLASAESAAAPNRVATATAWRVLGEARLALGRPAEALDALNRALAESERMDWPFMKAQALLALARHDKACRRFGHMQRVVMRAIRVTHAAGLEELHRQARRLSRFGVNGFAPLAELQRLVEHPGPVEALVAQGIELARALVRADRVAVYLLERGSPRLVGAHPAGVDPLVYGQELLSTVLSALETRQRHGLIGSTEQGWLADAEVRSLIALPLTGPHGPLGVIYLDRRALQEPFTRGEVRRLEAMAAYMALAIDRMHLSGGLAESERASRLEAALGAFVEAEQARRGFLGGLSADLRHQLQQVREALDAPEAARTGLKEAIAHAERLAEILERGIRD